MKDCRKGCVSAKKFLIVVRISKPPRFSIQCFLLFVAEEKGSCDDHLQGLPEALVYASPRTYYEECNRLWRYTDYKPCSWHPCRPFNHVNDLFVYCGSLLRILIILLCQNKHLSFLSISNNFPSDSKSVNMPQHRFKSRKLITWKLFSLELKQKQICNLLWLNFHLTRAGITLVLKRYCLTFRNVDT